MSLQISTNANLKTAKSTKPARRKYYSLKSHGLEFMTIVDQQNIYIGDPLNKYTKCIHIEIIDNIIYLQNISYNLKCSMNKVMQNGKNGTVIMMRTAIEFATHLFPNAKILEFQDNSSTSDKSINLSTYSYLLYGKTWYQINLYPMNLYIIDKNKQVLLKKYDEVLATYDSFKDEFKADPIYMKCKSWFEYFAYHKKNTKHMYKDIMDPIIKNIFKLKPLNGISWQGELGFILIDMTYEKITKPKELVWGGDNKSSRVINKLENKFDLFSSFCEI